MISFSGQANDAEDGEITAAIVWTSTVSGTIGSGGNYSASLPTGTHTVTARATDSGNLEGSDSVTVTVTAVTNTAPTVTITSPEQNPALGRPVQSSTAAFPGAEAEKVVDGLLDTRNSAWAAQGTPNWVEIDLGAQHTIDRLSVAPFAGSPETNYYYDTSWKVQYRNGDQSLRNFSNVTKLSGAGTLIGPGVAIADGNPDSHDSVESYKEYTFQFEPASVRQIRFTVIDGDSDGDSNAAEIAVRQVYTRESVVNFTGFAEDLEDGDLSSSIAWVSNKDGVLGIGPSISVSNLSLGDHTITASVTDSAFGTGSQDIGVRVVPLDWSLFLDQFESGDTTRWSSSQL